MIIPDYLYNVCLCVLFFTSYICNIGVPISIRNYIMMIFNFIIFAQSIFGLIMFQMIRITCNTINSQIKIYFICYWLIRIPMIILYSVSHKFYA